MRRGTIRARRDPGARTRTDTVLVRVLEYRGIVKRDENEIRLRDKLLHRTNTSVPQSLDRSTQQSRRVLMAIDPVETGHQITLLTANI